jgi:hypothetical protein
MLDKNSHVQHSAIGLRVHSILGPATFCEGEMRVVKYRKLLLVLIFLGVVRAIWIGWLRPPVYNSVCGPPPCDAELAIQQTLRQHFSGRTVLFEKLRTTDQLEPHMSDPMIVWIYRPLFTADGRRALVGIATTDRYLCLTYTLELRLRGDGWQIEDTERLGTLGSCGEL